MDWKFNFSANKEHVSVVDMYENAKITLSKWENKNNTHINEDDKQKFIDIFVTFGTSMYLECNELAVEHWYQACDDLEDIKDPNLRTFLATMIIEITKKSHRRIWLDDEFDPDYEQNIPSN